MIYSVEMKKITRIFLFASVALYLTSLWNRGFSFSGSWLLFIELLVLLGVVTYLVVPISKVILFPLHVLTFGLISIGFYMLLFYIASKYLGLVNIKPWTFSGGSVLGVTISKVNFSYLGNLAVISLSISGIINMLEKAA